jgi:hypothetical protein
VTTSLGLLESVLQLLAERRWTRSSATDRFFVFVPPDSERASDFRLYIPRDPAAVDFSRSIENSVEAIASFYGAPTSSIEALLLPASEVLSVRLAGEGYTGGAAPFPQFERMLEHLKRAITRAAAFVITDDPITQDTPSAAKRYLDQCWFMQTARGSFVTRVALPTSPILLYQYSLFHRPSSGESVTNALRRVATLVGERVLRNDPTVFSSEGFGAVRDSVSVNVLEELSKLLHGAGAKDVDLSFNRRGEEARVAMSNLTAPRLKLLDDFIAFTREQVGASFVIDVEGHVFEVRRARRGRGSNFVGMEAPVEGRLQDVTFKVDRGSLHVFLEHIESGLPIRVRGLARRLRTQIRIESDLQFDEPGRI